MATTFPTLTGSGKTPVVGDLINTIAADPIIRSPKEAGYVHTRARHTRFPRTWAIRYAGITTADKNLIRVHEEERGVGGASFTWTEPGSGTARTVRFSAPVRYQPMPDTNYARWNVDFELEQI